MRSTSRLYVELVAIRWIPTQVRLLAYFSNFVLIACLLGLGLGMVLERRPQRLLGLFPIGLAALVGMVLVLYATDFGLLFVAGSEWIWNTASEATSTLLAYIILVAFVMLCAVAFVPLGQEIGVRLHDLSPIGGYSINVAGSLAGVAAFVLISYLGLDPVWWFGVGLVILIGYQAMVGDRVRALALPVVLFIGVLGTIVLAERHEGRNYQTRWSPYYVIQVSPFGSVGYDIKVNRDSHQQALDLSGRFDDVAIARSRKTLWRPSLSIRRRQARPGHRRRHRERCRRRVAPGAERADRCGRDRPRDRGPRQAAPPGAPLRRPTRPPTYRRRTGLPHPDPRAP